MANQSKAALSCTLCVQFPQDQYPSTFAEATSIFTNFGDVARIDMCLSASTGRVLVTFYDVRSAELCLAGFRGLAMCFPSAPQDFRVIAVPKMVHSEMPASFPGFPSFGDVAEGSVHGEDLLVEFYDMRSAQGVIRALPGSRPHQQQSQTLCLAGALAETLPADSAAMPEDIMALVCSRLRAAGSPTSQGPGQTGILPQTPSNAGDVSPSDGSGEELMLGAARRRSTGEVSSTSDSPKKSMPAEKDLAQFDIIPEKILSGEDLRTTVMIRNIPRAWTQENFSDFLAKLSSENYTFLYMPIDKRREVHCGFAFVNFQSAHGVLMLHANLQVTAVRCSDAGATPLALSYARLQGQEQLLQQFSTSAVMRGSDARKRPIFLTGKAKQGKPEIKGEMSVKALDIQPRYVTVPGLGPPLSMQDDRLMGA